MERPAALIARETSRFRDLVRETGEKSARHLAAVATSTALRLDRHMEEEEEKSDEGDEAVYYNADAIGRDFDMCQVSI